MLNLNCQEISPTRFIGRKQTFRPSFARHAKSNYSVSGMTLVELLVVTVLVSILVTTAIPVLSPNNDSRKIREASRAINAFLSAAQAKSIETGRPFGVTFRRLSEDTGSSDDNGVCIALHQVEVPPTYTGLDSNSLARLASNPIFYTDQNWEAAPYLLQFVRRSDANTVESYNRNGSYPAGSLPIGYEADLFPESFFRLNDLIELRGQLFRIDGCSSGVDGNGYCNAGGGDLVQLGVAPVHFASFDENATAPFVPQHLEFIPKFDNQGNELPSPETLSNADSDDDNRHFWTMPSAYRVMRQPVPSSGEPLQLPGGTALDLQASGSGLNQLGLGVVNFHTPTDYWDDASKQFDVANEAPTILFKQGHAVVILPLLEEQPILDSVALCIGRRELIPAEPSEGASIRYGNDPRVYDEPVDLSTDLVRDPELDLTESEENREIMDQYNWLNMDSRWVVLSGRSGSITTVPNSYVNPGLDPDTTDGEGKFTVQEQISQALANASSRQSAGGR